MQLTYSQYFQRVLDYELQQVKDGGDRAGADKFRYLSSTQSQRAINEAIRELVLLNKDRYYAELTVQLFDSEALTTTPDGTGSPQTDGYIYIDSRTALSSDLKTLTLPPNVAELMAIQASTGHWVHLTQGSGFQRDMYISAAGKVYREDGWVQENITVGAEGTCFKAQVILFPMYERVWNVDAITGYDSTEQISLLGLESLRAGEKIRLGLDDSTNDDLGWEQSFTIDSLADITDSTSTSLGKFNWNVTPADASVLTGNPSGSLFYAEYDFSDVEVPFPIEYRRLLTLTIKKNAYSRKGKPLSNYEFADLKQLERRWELDGGQIRSKIILPVRGHGFGRRRR